MISRDSPVRPVTVTAPSRLHFGMFSFGRGDVRQFGGVGAMIEQPALQLKIEPADRFEVRGPHAARVREIADRVLANLSSQLGGEVALDDLALAIEIQQAPREHAGLGAGTQLALSVTAAILTALRLPTPSTCDLARLAGRGHRSAIGTHGFQDGGLLVEAGKREPDAISPLVARVELPEPWRFVLFTPREPSGISGDVERTAFAMLPPVPLETTERLTREVLLDLLPAAIAADFHQFSRSLHRFNAAAGLLFAAAQGGPFAAGPTSALVDWLRHAGIEGVGQSSWGPTVFALCRDENEAQQCAADSQVRWPAQEVDITVTAPANRGARITVG